MLPLNVGPGFDLLLGAIFVSFGVWAIVSDPSSLWALVPLLIGLGLSGLAVVRWVSGERHEAIDGEAGTPAEVDSEGKDNSRSFIVFLVAVVASVAVLAVLIGVGVSLVGALLAMGAAVLVTVWVSAAARA